MFAGYGMEYLWASRFNNFALGFEVFNVRKRDYKQRFDLLEYENVTGHSIFTNTLKIQILLYMLMGRISCRRRGYTVIYLEDLKTD